MRAPGILRQRGAIILMVLWTSAILTILVTVLASNVRLSATTAFNNRQGAEQLADVMAAVNKAEMELMLEHMPDPPDREMQTNRFGELRMPAYRRDGQPLDLSYPAGEDMVVRVYDHAGKINLNGIGEDQLREIIEKRLGPDFDPVRVQEMLAAWQDWTDLNDQAGPGGAEAEYYNDLEPSYRPRNNPELDSVHELLLIRGFDEVFGDVNLEAAFTVYGSTRRVNLNLATRETMELLPGLDEELIEEIIAYREVRDIRNMGQVGEILPVERLAELASWVGFTVSPYYSVFAYPRLEAGDLDVDGDSDDAAAADGEDADNQDPVTQAYRRIIEVRSYTERARVLQVDPYAPLPDTAPARVEYDF